MKARLAFASLAMVAMTSAGRAQDPERDPPGASMTRSARTSGPPGLVIAAPHEGFDLHSDAIARGVAEALGAARVTAAQYRKRSRRRFINVNRPTEEPWEGERFAAERETGRARRIYGRYQALIDEAAGKKPTPLLVEIHGNARKTRDGTSSIEVVECATVGISAKAARALLRLWPGDAPPLYFDNLPEHRRYRYRGQSVRFRYRASGAKKDGSLSRARAALHFECPSAARSDRDKRRRLIAAIAGILKAAVEDM